ncbi:hypothetical protein BDN72DRAFT_337141 [Pluteus cervinus]|uniref:Uncharacterized protein n=1 Tax=Pluteus cervinus TaxID=181527 RepID=A0ACD3AB99_9AGAR|nr:hypothetical protein BDN72DRAFT_337141 [Pluteus cervinus]
MANKEETSGPGLPALIEAHRDNRLRSIPRAVHHNIDPCHACPQASARLLRGLHADFMNPTKAEFRSRGISLLCILTTIALLNHLFIQTIERPQRITGSTSRHRVRRLDARAPDGRQRKAAGIAD